MDVPKHWVYTCTRNTIIYPSNSNLHGFVMWEHDDHVVNPGKPPPSRWEIPQKNGPSKRTVTVLPGTQLPSGYVKIAIENHHFLMGKIHYKMGHFSIAM